jgi:hypothetical protein
MPLSFTQNFKILLAKQTYDLLDITANSYLPASKQSYVYALMGKQNAWTNEATPDTPSENVDNINQYYRESYFAKQLSFNDASLVVSRINWESNTAYNTYESNTNFYVLNSKDQIFKCLDNNFGDVSTDEPEITLSSTSLEEPYLKTADDYKWKYMYSLTSSQKQKFLTEDWMPVTYNRFVRNAAISGSIDIVKIINSGNNYSNGATQSIIVVAGDGTGAVLKANVVSGQVTDIIIQQRGEDYTYATITFNDVGAGTNANAVVSISPHEGHGYDPVYELGASTVLFSVKFEEDEAGLLPTDNEFRRVILVQNPYEFGTTTLADASTYTLYQSVTTSPGVSSFINDETVYQGESLAQATFFAKVISFDEIQNKLYLNDGRGTIETNIILKGSTSGATRVVNSNEDPTMHLYTGKVLYIINSIPVTRDSAQTEQIRFILSF